MITDNELILLNKRGFIPGPDESEEDFIKRVDYCLNLKKDFSTKLAEHLPLNLTDMPLEISEKVDTVTRELFDIILNWVPVVLSDYKMTPWHGGCAWIFEMTPETPTGAFFQLRKVFSRKPTYLYIYNRDEIVEHESAHVGRMKFNEPKFEEYFAYQTADSGFRKWFGPIIQSPWEALAFFIILIFCTVGDLYLTYFGVRDPAWETAISWLINIDILLLILGVVRLYIRHRQLTLCHQNLERLLNSPLKARHVAYRLKDSEIIAFSKMDEAEIFDYAEREKDRSLRWKVIYKSYFC